jgi:uncharacterized protein (UPF0147 family)
MAHEKDLQDIIDVLKELESDTTVPRNIKTSVQNTIKALTSEGESSIKINKALHELEEVSDDTNMQPYTRTQIWNIVSMLEKINTN